MESAGIDLQLDGTTSSPQQQQQEEGDGEGERETADDEVARGEGSASREASREASVAVLEEEWERAWLAEGGKLKLFYL